MQKLTQNVWKIGGKMLHYKTFRGKKKNLEDLGLSKEFLDLTPKAWFIKKKKKKDKLDHSKLKLFVLRKRLWRG